MNIKLVSSDPELGKRLEAMRADGMVSPVEFQKLRDDADVEAAKFTMGLGVDVTSPAILGVITLLMFQKWADELVELMQRIALHSRKAGLSSEGRAAIKKVVEIQLAYVVAGHESSTERL